MKRLIAVGVSGAAIGAVIGVAVASGASQDALLRSYQQGFISGQRQAKRTAAVKEATARAIHPARNRSWFSSN